MNGLKSKKETGTDKKKPEEKLSLKAFGGFERFSKINFLFIGFFLLSMIFNLAKANNEVSPASILPFVIFILFFVILQLIGENHMTMNFQVVVLFLISYFVIFTNEVVYQAGYILFVFIYFLSRKYQLWENHRIISKIILLVFLVFSIVLSAINFPMDALTQTSPISIWHILNQFLFIITSIFLIYIVFEDDISRLKKENKVLNQQIERSSIFVNLGENISGLIHNMNGDLGLMTLAVSMLEDNVSDEAIGFVQRGNKNLQSKIRNIMTLAKYSQAEEDQNFSLNALISSLIDIFSLIKDFSIISTDTHFNNEVFVYGNPSEISQVFENIIKNAYEAILEKREKYRRTREKYTGSLEIQILGTSEYSIVSFKDNGPGFPTCIDCQFSDRSCLDCDVFQVGKTTKAEGTGIGMVSVIRTIKKYNGRLNIQSTEEGTIINVSLPRA